MTQMPSPNSNSTSNSTANSTANADSNLELSLDLQTPSNFLDELQGNDRQAAPIPKSIAPLGVELFGPSDRAATLSIKRGGFWQQLSLRSKATALAIMLSALPVMGVGLLAERVAGEFLMAKVQKSVQGEGSAVVEKLTSFMRERYGDIQIMAAQDVFTDAAIRDSKSALQKQVVLDEFVKAYPVYDSVAVFDLSGNPIAQSTGKPLGNHSDRVYFQDAVKTKKAVISQPIKSKTNGEMAVYLASPVFDRNTKQMIAVIRSRVPVVKLAEVVNASATAAGKGDIVTEFHIYDRGGELFLDSMDFVANPPKVDEKDEILQHHDIQELRSSVKGSNLSKIETKIGAKALLTYVPFTQFEDSFRGDLPSLGWSTVAAADRKIALKDQEQLLLTLLLGTAGSTVLVALLAAWIANRAVKPIADAADTVKKIGQGRLDVRMNVIGQDELADLATNVNQMAEQLGLLNTDQRQSIERAGYLSTVASGAQTLEGSQFIAYFNQILEKARTLMGVDRLVIYRFNDNFSGYIANEAVGMGLPKALNLDIADACIPEALIKAYKTGRIVPTSDVINAGFHPEHLQLMKTLQIRANLVAPILEDGQLYGLLVAHQCREVHDWTPGEISFLKQLAAQTTIALLLQQVQTARQSAEFSANEQRDGKELLQRRALELLIEVDPVSRGDLTVRAKVTEDEVGTIADSYNATIESLRKIVSQVQTAAGQVATTAQTNGDSVQLLSKGAASQTTEVNAALSQIQKMAESTRSVALNARKAETAVQSAAQTVQAGDEAMNRTVDGILAIRETVGEAAKKVKRLGEASQKISKVVNLIGSFANQTNLLALNASIEAAHAGEEGRGFAVVADEVRSLARQSAAATAEIEALVAEIQVETNQVVAAMEAGTEQVVTGTQLVEDARQSLNKITTVSQEISGLVDLISQSAKEQSLASDVVSKVMNDVADIAQETSTSAATVSDSFGDLVNVAQDLQASVGRFKVS
jgi:methyl-accepting chemotaxis protein PixJ